MVGSIGSRALRSVFGTTERMYLHFTYQKSLSAHGSKSPARLHKERGHPTASGRLFSCDSEWHHSFVLTPATRTERAVRLITMCEKVSISGALSTVLEHGTHLEAYSQCVQNVSDAAKSAKSSSTCGGGPRNLRVVIHV